MMTKTTEMSSSQL